MSGVQIGPGATALTRIFLSTSWCARERVKETMAPLGFEEPRGLARIAVFGEVDDGHIGAFAGEEDSHAAADATIPAGDERHFALEFSTAAIIAAGDARARRHLGLKTGRGLVLGR